MVFADLQWGMMSGSIGQAAMIVVMHGSSLHRSRRRLRRNEQLLDVADERLDFLQGRRQIGESTLETRHATRQMLHFIRHVGNFRSYLRGWMWW